MKFLCVRLKNKIFNKILFLRMIFFPNLLSIFQTKFVILNYYVILLSSSSFSEFCLIFDGSLHRNLLRVSLIFRLPYWQFRRQFRMHVHACSTNLLLRLPYLLLHKRDMGFYILCRETTVCQTCETDQLSYESVTPQSRTCPREI